MIRGVLSAFDDDEKVNTSTNGEKPYNDDSISNSNVKNGDILDVLKKENEYTNITTTSSSYIVNHEFEKAIDGFKNAIAIATDLSDPFKINESNANYAIALFYCGKVKEAGEKFDALLTDINALFKGEKIPSNIQQIYIVLKITANASLCFLAQNKNKKCIETVNDIISFINKEVSYYKQLNYLKYIDQIFFRVDSLNSNLNSDSDIIEDGTELNEHKKTMRKLLLGFNTYLKTKDVNSWIDTLKDTTEKMKSIKDYNGLIFAIFNHQASVYMRETSINSKPPLSTEAIEAKYVISGLIKALNENSTRSFISLDEKLVDKILKNFKDKMTAACKIYQMLLAVENKINSTINRNIMNNSGIGEEEVNESRISAIANRKKTNTEFYIKLLIKYTIDYINKYIPDDSLRTQLKSQLEETVSLIDAKRINLDEIKLNSLNPEISRCINILFDNLIYIYGKMKKIRCFKKMKTQAESISLLEKSNKLQKFFEDCYIIVCTGEVVMKINMNSVGSILHFYMINYDTDMLCVFQKQSYNRVNPRKTYSFKKILKYMNGIRSVNLHKKVNSLVNAKQPWLFGSFILEERSIDFAWKNDEMAKKWFYGFYYYFSITKRKYKIISCSGFVIGRLKMKMQAKLGIERKSFVRTFLSYSRNHLNE